jgi:hypothetical protein
VTAALRSLYGAPPALAGHAGKAEREQTVLTPPWVLDAAREALGGEILMDPCAAPDPAAHFATVRNVVHPREDGLVQPWIGGTYMNPPFADLQVWLEKAYTEAEYGYPIVGLFPWRPHRRWFHAPLRGAEVVFLHYDVRFVGHTTAFPAPLVLVGWNCKIPPLGPRETDRRVW